MAHIRDRRLFLREALRHGFLFASFWTGVITVIWGGSVVGGLVWLLSPAHRVGASLLIAFGLLVAVFEGSYRIVRDLNAVVTQYKARVLELDSAESKRAYLDRQLARAEQLKADISSIDEDSKPDSRYGWQETPGVTAVISDVNHWEATVRAELREWFSLQASLRFDDETGLYPDEIVQLAKSRSWPIKDAANAYRSKANTLAYVDRRIIRLNEIRATVDE